METTIEASKPNIAPGTSAAEAALYAAKSVFPSTASKIGYWRPLIVAVMAYMGWDKHSDRVKHEHRMDQIEAFVQSPPTNGRRIHEIPPPPIPLTNFMHRK